MTARTPTPLQVRVLEVLNGGPLTAAQIREAGRFGIAPVVTLRSLQREGAIDVLRQRWKLTPLGQAALAQYRARTVKAAQQ